MSLGLCFTSMYICSGRSSDAPSNVHKKVRTYTLWVIIRLEIEYTSMCSLKRWNCVYCIPQGSWMEKASSTYTFGKEGEEVDGYLLIA